MNKRPVTFIEWREVFHRELFNLAIMVEGRWRRSGCSRVRIDRTLWHVLDRVRRIDIRLDVECEVMDRTFCEDLFRYIMSGGEKP